MIKTYVSLTALSFLMACSAAASPNAATPAAMAAPASQSASTPVSHTAPVAVAEAPVAASMRGAPTVRPVRETVAASRASFRDAVSCEVRVRPTSNGIVIQAVAHADRAIEGDYELVITRSGGGGSSDVTQGGPFSAAAGESVTLGSTELGAGGRYRAVLVLRDVSGELCRRERRS